MFKENKEGQTHSFNDGCGEPEHNPEKLNKMSQKDLKELWKLAESEIIEWESFIQKIKKELSFFVEFCGNIKNF